MEGLLLGVRDDPLSTLGRVQGSKAAELLMDVKVSRLTPLRQPSLVAQQQHIATARTASGDALFWQLTKRAMGSTDGCFVWTYVQCAGIFGSTIAYCGRPSVLNAV